MADYTTVGTGLVFKNLKRASQNQPHYSGTVKINGEFAICDCGDPMYIK